jgi:hypothetical protein
MGNCNFKTDKNEAEKAPELTKNMFLLHYIIGKGGFGKVKYYFNIVGMESGI